MDMSKYRALFIEEGREHLQALSGLLVQAETERSATFIDEIFRHAHSVKGMAASMGYAPIANLAHRLEDVVGAHRGRILDAEAVDLLLRAVDALDSQIEAIATEGSLDEHIELLQALREATGAARARDESGVGSSAPAEQSPAEDSEAGKTSAAAGRRVVVRLDETTSAPSVRAFLVHRRLSALATIVGSDPSEEKIRAGTFDGRVLRFDVADLDDDECRRALVTVPDVEEVTFEAPELPPDAEPKPGRTVVGTEERATTRAGPMVRVRTDVLDGLIDDVGELFIVRERLRALLGSDVRPEVRAAIDMLGARVRQIHDQVMTVRMTPLTTLTDRYPRLVRDLSRTLGKDVELEVKGAEIEIDRAILDHLDTPFVHTLRNAIDHGLESAAERLERNKSPAGRVSISASRDRDSVVVTIADDGRGLDAEDLRARAVSRGLINEVQAENMSARECYFLICAPGFSTKSKVSDVSGRGVGMDIVRSEIEGLGGHLDIQSELGGGTRFTFRLPLTLAITPVLLVEAAGRTFALPAGNVVAVREPAEDVFEQAGGNRYLSFQHALVLITPLAVLFRLRATSDHHQVIVVEDGRDLYALAVDRVVGYHEVVVKPLGEPLDSLDWYSGATVLGDGRPILIVDAPKALRARAAA